MEASTLPMYFVLQATTPSGPYLCPVEAAANEPSHVLMFVENQIFSPRVKFATEQSDTSGEDETLVHIRSCYNNKYWVPLHETDRPAGQQFRIAASADKPEEDGTNDACTLFRVSSTGTTDPSCFELQSIRWPDVYVGVDESGALVLNSTTTTFSAVDWENLVILPSQVTFKSVDQDGNYLKAFYDTHYSQQFVSGLEFDDELVGYQLFPTSQGYYRIKSLHFRQFLRRGDSNWIWADAGDTNVDNDPDTIFEFIKVQDNIFSLRNLGNNAFCGADSSDPHQTNCLSALYPEITRKTKLIIEERVIRREISNLQYHLPRSRIFGGQVLALAEQTIQNGSPHKDLEQDINFSETIETTTSWNNSMSVKVGASTEFEVSAIPFIAKAKVTLSLDIGYEHQWGGSKVATNKIETNTKVVVPPLTNMKASLLCTKATCDVPFSYTLTDLLPSGQKVSTVKHDGLYTGVNVYDFNIRTTEVDENGQELKLLKVEPVTILK